MSASNAVLPPGKPSASWTHEQIDAYREQLLAEEDSFGELRMVAQPMAAMRDHFSVLLTEIS